MSVDSQHNGRIKVAICGEVNTGKTSLIQAVLRDIDLPAIPDGMAKPILRLALADADTPIQYRTKDGEVLDVDTVDQIPMDDSVAEITIPSAYDAFGACDIIEFPALNDRTVTRTEIDPISGCDIFVWMTIGSQAWRLSEKTIVDKIPNRPIETSLLVVSRVDKLRSASDRDRLTQRLSAETSGHFAKGAMLGATPKALVEAKTDDDVWASIGGQDITATLAELVTLVRAQQDAASAAELAAPLPDALADPAGFAPSKRIRRLRKSWRERTEPVAATQEEPITEDAAPLPEPVVATEEETPVAEPKQVDAADAEGQAEPTAQDNATEMERLAGSVEGLVSLATFDLDAPETVNLIAGQADQAVEFATHLSGAAQVVLSDPAFSGAETVHMTLKSHQILFGQADAAGPILMLVCRSSNPGMARSAFARMTQNHREMADA